MYCIWLNCGREIISLVTFPAIFCTQLTLVSVYNVYEIYMNWLFEQHLIRRYLGKDLILMTTIMTFLCSGSTPFVANNQLFT